MRLRDEVEIAYWNPVLAAIERYCEHEMLALDIGANRGLTARTMSRVARNVVAFEPIPQCAQIIRDFNFPNVEVVELAVSNFVGQATFNVDEREGEGMEASSLRVLGDNFRSEITVNVTTIDHFVADRGLEPAFIKMDVEGCEELAIQGGMTTIERLKPILVFEVWGYNWPRFASTIEQLKNWYRFVRVSNGKDAVEEYGSTVVTENDDVLCLPI